MYVIQPSHPWWKDENWSGGARVSEGFRYTSDANPQWLTAEQLQELIDAGSPAIAAAPNPQRQRARA